MTSPITTHVLDVSRGAPAAGVRVTLARESAPGEWTGIGQGTTDTDGRLKTLLAPGALRSGAFRITFAVGDYFAARGVESFYREVCVEFIVRDASAHHHVPLLVSPYGYSTYRGS